ncbi:MAG: ABC transporter ATP-binding protein [Acidobacteria bacterium]|nr:MAG: ABC transporter ATP-binding protein [Acidobacteriota bacterium]
MSAATNDPPEVIRVRGLSKHYRRTAAGHKLRTLKSALLERSLIRGLRPEEAIPALQDLSFTVRAGEAVGLIGANGSGKSTLLKVLAGILRPTAGTVEVDGRVAAMIELGAGFHPEISGRENVFINGAILGLSRRQIAERYDDIVAFAGLEDFIEEPVKNYSSGMYVRLGFAVAIHTDPEILLVDEVLSVGDEAFAHKCLRRIEEFLARGKTLVLVSHALPLVESVCDRALWLERGRLRLAGHPRRVADAYRQAVAESEGEAHRAAKILREDESADEATPPPEPAAEEEDADAVEAAEVLRWGSGEARIERLRVLAGGEERYHLHCGERVGFEVEVNADRDFTDFVFGIAIQTPRGVECWGTNTDLEGFQPELLPAGTTTFTITCPSLRLAPGEYLVDVAVHARDGTPYDYRRKLAGFTVTAAGGGVGVYFPEHAWTFPPSVRWRRRGDAG